jgi:hypothetical protein
MVYALGCDYKKIKINSSMQNKYLNFSTSSTCKKIVCKNPKFYERVAYQFNLL